MAPPPSGRLAIIGAVRARVRKSGATAEKLRVGVALLNPSVVDAPETGPLARAAGYGGTD